jgi:antitoxin CptB
MSNLHNVSDRLQDKDSHIRCVRLLFRCWHRGTQESDLILGRFAEAYLADLDSAQIERFEVLLDCADADLFDWIIGGSTPPKEYDQCDVPAAGLRSTPQRKSAKPDNSE